MMLHRITFYNVGMKLGFLFPQAKQHHSHSRLPLFHSSRLPLLPQGLQLPIDGPLTRGQTRSEVAIDEFHGTYHNSLTLQKILCRR
jgi:hypothetical protein